MNFRIALLPLVLLVVAGCAVDGQEMPLAQSTGVPKKAEPTVTEDKKTASQEEAKMELAAKDETADKKETAFVIPPKSSIFLPPTELTKAFEATHFPMRAPSRVAIDLRTPGVKVIEANDLTEVRTRLNQKDLEQLSSHDDLGRVPLHYAKTAEMVDLLWDLPIVVGEGKNGRNNTVTLFEPAQDVPDREGLFPLHTVAAKGNAGAIRAFTGKWCGWWHSSYLNRVDPEGRTALHLAAMNNKLDSINELLSCSWIDTEIQDRQQRTALHYAAELPTFPQSGLLYLYRMSEGARDMQDARGETPMDIIKRINPESYALLKAMAE